MIKSTYYTIYRNREKHRHFVAKIIDENQKLNYSDVNIYIV